MSKFIKIIICLFVSIALIAVCFTSRANISMVFNKSQGKKLPIYCVDKKEKVVSISFDCAWGNEFTLGLLQTMQRYDVKCTFFTVSFWAEKYKQDVKNIIDYGHEIGTHSVTHSYMSKLKYEDIVKELTYSSKVIEEISGQKVKLFRAPYGDYDDLLINTATQLGLSTIQWDVDSLDWKNLSAKEIANRVIKRVKNGSIILCHNNGLHTLESLPLIFTALIEKGYKFVKISDLIYYDNFEIDVNGKQYLVE